MAPAWSQTSVEPRAREIFANAGKRYSTLKTLQMSWKDYATEQFEDGGNITGYARGVMAFDRSGLLKWQSKDPSSRYSLVVVDGKNTSLLVSEKVNLKPHPVYERKAITASQKGEEAFARLSERGEWFPVVSYWLQGKSLLTRRNLKKATQKYKIASYSAKMLPTAKFNNQACELVRINATYTDKKLLQETYWFQKNNGQLVRIQRKKPNTKLNDIRFETLQLNPKLPATTFRFVPPKNAMLVKAG